MHARNQILALALACLTGCSLFEPKSSDPVLTARPGPVTQAAEHGRTQFAAAGSQAVVYVPPSVNPAQPTGLVLYLHGASRTVDFYVTAHRPVADETGVIILAPFAHTGTWDAIDRGFGPDPRIIDAALAWVFERWTIDPARIAISGFSDGATYALAIGRRNGLFFSRIAAYAPGAILDVKAEGRPSILVSHGTDDQIFPVNSTSRRIVPWLLARGYPVDYREFEGPHGVYLPALETFVRSMAPAP